MTLHRRSFPTMVIAAVVLALVSSTTVLAQGPVAAPASQSGTSGFRALTGRAAANFRVPADMTLIRTWRDARHNLTYRRYQQFVQPFDAFVDDAQLTVAQRGRATVLVIGAHYPSAAATNRLLVTGKEAVDRVSMSQSLAAEVPASARPSLVSTAQLRLDPVNGRLFQRVQSGAPGVLVFHDIDAETGAVLDVWSGINEVTPGMGTGVKNDRKSLKGEDDTLGTGDDLTQFVASAWKMQSVDGRILSYDAKKSFHLTGLSVFGDNQKPAWHNDNDWAAPYERAAVDIQFYARMTDDWYLDQAGFDFLDTTTCPDPAHAGQFIDYGPIKAVVHYTDSPGQGYDNAFWDPPTRMLVFGDGDGFSTGQFSGAQDVVSHELSHRVTECRAPLKYQGQSGALNEAFSDMVASTIEQEVNEPLSTNCRRESGQAGCPDWWVGEDSILSGAFGFRSLSNPDSTNQPSHWDDHICLTCFFDSGGVHINSTIVTHAFYLMVNGGRNARCSGASDPQADCDVVVPTISLADASDIVFGAWGQLTDNATFCEAHDAAVAEAEALFPGSANHRAAVELAWQAVGRGEADCHPSPAPLTVSPRSIILAPGTGGDLTASQTGVDATVSSPAVATITPAGSATIHIDVPAGMADGVYPISVSTGGTDFASAALIVDGDAPTAVVSKVALPGSGTVSTSGAVPLSVTWAANDAASGIASAQLEKSPDAAPASWTTVATGTGGTSSATVTESTQWFRVSATDAAGNSGTSDESGAWLIGRFQEGSAVYKGSWSALPNPQNWDSVRYSTSPGATARFTFTGTDVSWISTKAPKRGKAKVYIDNVLQGTVDLFASSKQDRRIVFTASGLSNGTHTLRIEVLGTASRPRIDIGGFAVLSPPAL